MPRRRPASPAAADIRPPARPPAWHAKLRLWLQAFFLTWIFYVTAALLIFMFVPDAPLPMALSSPSSLFASPTISAFSPS